MIREVILVTAGDSKDPANWSNVPYLFARTLESKGIIVHRVHYNPTKFIKKLYTHIAYKIHCITKSDSFNLGLLKVGFEPPSNRTAHFLCLKFYKLLL